MPIVNGNIYPEIKIYPIDNKTLTIALLDIDDQDAVKFAHKLSIAEAYIRDKFIGLCDFNVFVRSSDAVESKRDIYNYATFPHLDNDHTAMLEFAKSNDVDVFMSNNDDHILDLYKNNPPFELANSIDQLEVEVEAFLTGKNISWSLNSPAWNSTWINKSFDNRSLTNTLHTFLNAAQNNLKYTQKQIGLVRALSNKAGHIRHCEENLVALVQKKNYSSRNCRVTNSYGYEDSYDYSFELNYHLGNYYFLISGCIDILGSLLADVYAIELNHTVKPNIARQEFQDQLKTKSQELYELYSEQSLNGWMISLKRKRNFVAHESEASYTDVLKSKKEKISDGELKKRVDALQNWQSMELLIGSDAVESHKRFAEFVIRLKEDNEVLTKDAMQFSYYDQNTSSEQCALFHPLIDLKYDYEKVERILSETVNILTA